MSKDQQNIQLTESDVKAGMFVVPTNIKNPIHTNGYLASVMKQVGWTLSAPVHGQKYSLNSVCDGWCYDNNGKFFTKHKLAEFLNNSGQRVATKAEVLAVMNYVTRNYK